MTDIHDGFRMEGGLKEWADRVLDAAIVQAQRSGRWGSWLPKILDPTLDEDERTKAKESFLKEEITKMPVRSEFDARLHLSIASDDDVIAWRVLDLLRPEGSSYAQAVEDGIVDPRAMPSGLKLWVAKANGII